MYCRKCGNEIPENAKFCPKCGNPITKPVQPKNPVTQDQPAEEKAGKVSAATNDEGKNTGKKHTKRNASIAVVACAAAAVVLLVTILPRVDVGQTAEAEEYASAQEDAATESMAAEESPEEETVTIWVKTTETKYKDSEITEYIEYIYDDEHRLTSMIYYDAPGGNPTGETIDNIFDENGNQTMYRWIQSDGYEERYEDTYDENGNLTSEVYTEKGVIDNIDFIFMEDKEYTYDENGILTSMFYTNYSNFSVSNQRLHIEYSYDENDNLILEVWTDSYGSVTSTEYAYDENGNLTSQVGTESDGSWTSYEYTYDENGNQTSEIYTTSDGSGYSYKYTYDENGNMTLKSHTYSNGSKTDTEEYTYDKNNNMTSEVRTDADGSRTSSEYTYDENGNLISEVKTNSDGSVTRKEYTYESYEESAEEPEAQDDAETENPVAEESAENTTDQSSSTDEAASDETPGDKYDENSLEYVVLTASQAAMEGDSDTYFSLLVPYYIDYLYEWYGPGDAESSIRSSLMNDRAKLLPSENAVASNYTIESISDLPESELKSFLDEDAGYMYGPAAFNTQAAATVKVSMTVTDSGNEKPLNLYWDCVEYNGKWYIYPPGF